MHVYGKSGCFLKSLLVAKRKQRLLLVTTYSLIIFGKKCVRVTHIPVVSSEYLHNYIIESIAYVWKGRDYRRCRDIN